MDKLQQFVVVMAAISTASQKLTDQLVKGRFVDQLDTPNPDPVKESRREAWIHLICGIFGILLCIAMKIDPLLTLRDQAQTIKVVNWSNGQIMDILITGVMVTFGGSFFNELLGALQQFKDTQSQLKDQLASQIASDPSQKTPPVVQPQPGAAQIAPQKTTDVRDPDAEAYDDDYFDVAADLPAANEEGNNV